MPRRMTPPGATERGAMTVECAVVLPLFLLCAIAVIEYSRFIANRSQIEVALRKAGEYGATLGSGCLTSARDRFFEAMQVLKSGGELTFTGHVVPFTNEVEAIRIVVTGSEPSLLNGLNLAVRSVGLFPIEIPGGCHDKTELVSSVADYLAASETAD